MDGIRLIVMLPEFSPSEGHFAWPGRVPGGPGRCRRPSLIHWPWHPPRDLDWAMRREVKTPCKSCRPPSRVLLFR